MLRGVDSNMDPQIHAKGITEVPNLDSSSDRLLTEKDVAGILNVSVSTARRWRMLRKGPAFTKLTGSSLVRYRATDLAEYLENARKN